MSRRNESGLPQAAGSSVATSVAGRRHARGAAPARLQAPERFQTSLLPHTGRAPALADQGTGHGIARWQQDMARHMRPELLAGFHPVKAPPVEAIVAHYQRLTPDDRRLRFGGTLSEEQLSRMARDAVHRGVETLGLMTGDHLAALAETFEIPGTGFAEAAFSVEHDLQGHHLGWHLLNEVLREAARKPLRGIIFQCAATNAAMLGLARHAGAVLQYQGSEIIGRLHLGA